MLALQLQGLSQSAAGYRMDRATKPRYQGPAMRRPYTRKDGSVGLGQGLGSVGGG